MARPSSWITCWRILRDTFVGFNHDQGMRLAAALAFYTVLSLGPLVVALLLILGKIVGPERAQSEVTAEIHHLISGPAADAVARIVQQAAAPRGHGITLLLSLGVLVFSATAVFAQLQDAMNAIWNVPRARARPWLQILRTRLVALLMLFGLTALTVSMVVISSVLDFLARTMRAIHPDLVLAYPLLDWGISLLVFVTLFAVIFKLVPEAEIPWRDVRIGALVTGLLFALGREVISAILSRSQPNSAYGAAGSMIVVLLWVYYSSLILFIGAEFTQSLTRHRAALGSPLELTSGSDGQGDVSPPPSVAKPMPLPPASQAPPESATSARVT